MAEQATSNHVLGCSCLNLFSMLDEQETTCSRKRRKPAKLIPKKKRHYHCCAFLLKEKFTLADINLDESAKA